MQPCNARGKGPLALNLQMVQCCVLQGPNNTGADLPLGVGSSKSKTLEMAEAIIRFLKTPARLRWQVSIFMAGRGLWRENMHAAFDPAPILRSGSRLRERSQMRHLLFWTVSAQCSAIQ